MVSNEGTSFYNFELVMLYYHDYGHIPIIFLKHIHLGKQCEMVTVKLDSISSWKIILSKCGICTFAHCLAHEDTSQSCFCL